MDPTLRAFLGSWKARPDVLIVLGMLGAAYLSGWLRLRRRGAPAAPAWGPAAYLSGLTIIGLALLSPIDAFASSLFIMHMIQHELLVMAAPPLLLLANPLAAVLWALPPGTRHWLGGWLVRGSPLRRMWRLITLIPVAWLLYVGTLWGWHYPSAYEASLGNDRVHDAQHLSFFLTAVLFWWPIINPAPRLHGHIPYAFRIPYLLAAIAQNTGLAFVITMTERVLYPHYAAVPRLWGITALDDQAVGGAIMWVVNGMMYVAAIVILVARFLDREAIEGQALQRLFRRMAR